MKIDIRAAKVELTDELRAWVERRLAFALGAVGDHVRRVEVRLADVNGPKGGPDQRCAMEASLDGLPPVLAEVTDSEMPAAVSRAAERLGRSIRAALERSREGRRTERPRNPPPARTSPARKRNSS